MIKEKYFHRLKRKVVEITDLPYFSAVLLAHSSANIRKIILLHFFFFYEFVSPSFCLHFLLLLGMMCLYQILPREILLQMSSKPFLAGRPPAKNKSEALSLDRLPYNFHIYITQSLNYPPMKYVGPNFHLEFLFQRFSNLKIVTVQVDLNEFNLNLFFCVFFLKFK